MKYNVIVCDNLFNTLLISFCQSMSRYTPVFPNCSIFVSFGSYFGILYCFSNIFWYSYFILLGLPTCPIRFTYFVSFKFIICISIIISSISFSLI